MIRIYFILLTRALAGVRAGRRGTHSAEVPPAPRALAARGRESLRGAAPRQRGRAARGLPLPANAVPGSRAAGLRLGARGPPTRKARVRAQACRPTCVP